MLASEPAGLTLVRFGSVIFCISKKRMYETELQYAGKQLFHCNLALRLIMHFLRASIFSIVVLAFLASASSLGSSASCAAVYCDSNADCGEGCHCKPNLRGIVSSLLLPARSKLT